MRTSRLLAAAIGSCSLLLSLPLATAAHAATGPTIDNGSLTNGGRACTASTSPMTLGYFADTLQAAGTSSTSGTFSYTIWPLANPSAVTTLSATNYNPGRVSTVTVPDSVLVDGNDYAWHVQLSDGSASSPYSSTCTFHYDITAPAAPAVSSNFPPNGNGFGPVGQFAQFTFDAQGNTDAAGFEYTWGQDLPAFACQYSGPAGQLVCPDYLSQPGAVRANTLGGTASVTLQPPGPGPQTMTVAALDVAGNISQPPMTYQINVPDSEPVVTRLSPIPPHNNRMRYSFAPNPGVSNVVAYRYDFPSRGTDPITVRADKQGNATVTFTVTANDYAIRIRSISANGFVSSENYAMFNVDPRPNVYASIYQNSGEPAGGVGVSDTFTFAPADDYKAIAAYQYQFPGGQVSTVAIGDDPFGDETASVSWAPTRRGEQTLLVREVYLDGSGLSPQRKYTFVVATKAP